MARKNGDLRIGKRHTISIKAHRHGLKRRPLIRIGLGNKLDCQTKMPVLSGTHFFRPTNGNQAFGITLIAFSNFTKWQAAALMLDKRIIKTFLARKFIKFFGITIRQASGSRLMNNDTKPGRTGRQLSGRTITIAAGNFISFRLRFGTSSQQCKFFNLIGNINCRCA